MRSVLAHSLVQRAAKFARAKHKYQKRLNGEPYFVHPEAVAKNVAKWTNNPKVVAAAYLHDVIEDTGCDYEILKKHFSSKVADYVAMLSRDFRKPKKASLIEFRNTLRKASGEVKLIAAADIHDNVRSEASPDFMRKYFEKTLKTLPYLKAGKLGKYREGIGDLIVKIQARIRMYKS